MTQLCKFLLVLTLALVASPVVAQRATKVHMHAQEGYAADGLLFEPDGTGPSKALILVPDEWGLTTFILDQAKSLAGGGFLVIAVDLYRGVVATDLEQAAQLSRKLTNDQALRDLKAAIAFLRDQPQVRTGHIGAVGWSSGGLYALELAAIAPDLTAVVMNGSLPPARERPLKGLKSAILLNIAGGDPNFSAAALRSFEGVLRASGVRVDVKVYPLARHDFIRADLVDSRSDDALDVETRTRTFLASALDH